MVKIAGVILNVCAICLGLFGACLIYLGYDASMEFFIKAIRQEHNLLEIKSKVTPIVFYALQVVLALCLIIFIGLRKYQSKWLPGLLLFLEELLESLKTVMRQATRFPNFMIFILPLVTAIFYMIYLPVSYDEAYTYLNFTSKTPIASVCFYPAPNNHVFHSLLTNFTYWLPFGALFNLRISAILVSLMTWMVLFHVIKSSFGSKTSLLSTSITSVLFLSIFYSFESRGYGLVTLFSLISAYSGYKIYVQPHKLFYYQVWAISNILGFFTMPSFLYPFLTITGVLLLFRYQSFKKILQFSLLILLSSVVLYLPIMIVSGPNALIANKFVSPLAREIVWSRLPSFLSDTIGAITGFPWFLAFLLMIIGLGKLVWNGSKKLFWLFLLLLVAPACLMLVQSVIPFSRSFVYYGFVFSAIAIVPWMHWIEKISLPLVLTMSLILQAIFIYNFGINIAAFERYNTTFHEINKVIVQPNTSYYINSRIFDTNMNFELVARGIKRGKYHHEFGAEPMSADTISGYDYLILDKNLDATRDKKAFLEDPYVRVYKCQ